MNQNINHTTKYYQTQNAGLKGPRTTTQTLQKFCKCFDLIVTSMSEKITQAHIFYHSLWWCCTLQLSIFNLFKHLMLFSVFMSDAFP